MKVLYDTQCFDMQKIGGVSRYFFELMKYQREHNTLIFPYEYTDNVYLIESQFNDFKKSLNDYSNFLTGLDFKGKWRLYQLINKLCHPKTNKDYNKEKTIELLQNQDFDVFHPTYYDSYFLDYLGNKPFVLTIHDMIHEKYPEFYIGAGEIKNKKLLAEKATKIIAISESTKKDIIDIYGKEYESKIEIVYHGSSLKTSHTKEIDFKAKFGKYILFTGSRNAYKNFYSTVHFMSDFLRDNNMNLVCTGSSFSAQELKYFSDINISDRIKHHFAKETEFYDLYNQAECFIFPSYYEGFGIPVLEAFECKVPCILANASCFREIGGDACLYFNPKSKEELVKTLECATDSENRKKMIEAGIARLQSFSWEKTAFQTDSIYRSVL